MTRPVDDTYRDTLPEIVREAQQDNGDPDDGTDDDGDAEDFADEGADTLYRHGYEKEGAR